MQEAPAPESDDYAPPPGLKALLVQLGEDAKDFARAEADWIRAEAGERADIAKPALLALLVGVGLVFGITTAIPVGVMLLLAPLIGPGLALLASTGAFLLIAGLLFTFGSQRMKVAFKPRDDT